MDTPETFTQMSEQVRRKLKVAMQENARLKADVQYHLHQAVHDVSQLGEQSAEIAHLKAQVERLTRAGDLMLKYASSNMPYPPYVTIAKDWNAAKEGKQSQ
jgi:hypothetical protein